MAAVYARARLKVIMQGALAGRTECAHHAKKSLAPQVL
jgi:hypothetical protein